MDGAFTKILGNLWAGVVGAKGFLVDVLFKDVAQHIGVDLIVAGARRIIQVPRVTAKEIQQVGKGEIWDANIRVIIFQTVFEKKTAIQIFDWTKQLFCGFTGIGFSKAFKKERL